MALSPDGTRLAVELARDRFSDIWVKELDRGPLTRLTVGEQRNFRPAWSPDGREVRFIVQLLGTEAQRDVLTRRRDGSGAIDTLAVGATRGPIDELEFSRDGSWLVYRTGVSDGRRDLWARRLDRDSTFAIEASPNYDEYSPALSPDGRWLAFVSTETGRPEVYLRPFPEGPAERRKVSLQGGHSPAWSGDGSEIFFAAASGHLVAVDLAVATGSAQGAPRLLFATTGLLLFPTHRSFEPSRDGSFLMLRQRADRAGGQLILVLDFLAELQAKVPR